MGRQGRARGWGPAASLAIAFGGCATDPPSSRLESIPGEDDAPRGALSAEERDDVLRIMRSVATDGEAAPSGAIETGLRWPDDAGAAARAALGTAGIEMAVVRVETPGPDELVFELIGVRGEPGELRVRHDGGKVVAEATTGRFPEAPDEIVRAAQLVATFDEKLAAFAARRKLAR